MSIKAEVLQKKKARHMRLTRRGMLSGLVGLAATPLAGWAIGPIASGLSVTSMPPRPWGAEAPPVNLPDPDILVLDPAFGQVNYGNAPLQRVWQGAGWLEGPAWCTVGRFLLLSDTLASRQYRYDPEDGPQGHISVYRRESYNANGNTFDEEGRLITCEHGMRRVIRWEHDGRASVLADRYRGKPLNSPNDVVVAPDGSIWFTDPGYGDGVVEGHADAEGPANPHRHLNPYLDAELTSQYGGLQRQEDHTFRIDGQTGKIEAVLAQKDVAGPNGLCFSPDGTKLYVVSSGVALGAQPPLPDHSIHVFDIKQGRPVNGRIFTDFTVAGHPMRPDGLRADVEGNLWCGAWGPLGLCGVLIYSPEGKMIGRIRLPIGCSNLTFGGPKRNILYMCCGTALFSLVTATQGAGYC
ncbi:SMP-30/gluconolactonase/LRE family protein [Bombella saccharophila]|uniref:SMP-30/gluconolactonase/LRE family protein n=1 Tax=Bombella saccharophila TaxID=2967338 RepID=A0ABT3W412_9PROT|nr:SMP-30/gluconolactonase/LRE family protein [Bombella saccharophila]MCX5613791.1 SMP-30/gluconolactonase/LRE family protein [Bombella saccharophila]